MENIRKILSVDFSYNLKNLTLKKYIIARYGIVNNYFVKSTKRGSV